MNLLLLNVIMTQKHDACTSHFFKGEIDNAPKADRHIKPRHFDRGQEHTQVSYPTGMIRIPTDEQPSKGPGSTNVQEMTFLNL